VRIDSHTHVVAGDRTRYPTVGPGTGLWWERPTPARTLLAGMDASGVDRAVLVQAVGPYAFDNRAALDATAAHPDRFACVVAVDLDAPDALDTAVELAGRPGVVGVRAFAVRGFGVDHTSHWVDSGGFGEVLQTCRTIVLTAFADQLARLLPSLAAHPGTPVAIDHGGFPDWSATRHPTLDALAELPHVSVKISGHVVRDAPDPAGAFAMFLERFGPERVIAGTDYPQTAPDYGALWSELLAVAPAGDDARGFLGENAERLWFT
jgi:predicted TIM-barrel fold metal-dependent hydrolase